MATTYGEGVHRKPHEISIDEVEHLRDNEYIVHWSWLDSSFPHTTLVPCEFEPKDPSVGYFESYFYGTGDCPNEVNEAAAEAASLRLADAWNDEQEWERE